MSNHNSTPSHAPDVDGTKECAEATVSHTPGPWEVWTDSNTPWPGIDGGGGSIVSAGSDHDSRGVMAETLEEALANARLIAAAPDLLAACKQVLHELTEPVMLHIVLPRLCEVLRAAIAKAER